MTNRYRAWAGRRRRSFHSANWLSVSSRGGSSEYWSVTRSKRRCEVVNASYVNRTVRRRGPDGSDASRSATASSEAARTVPSASSTMSLVRTCRYHGTGLGLRRETEGRRGRSESEWRSRDLDRSRNALTRGTNDDGANCTIGSSSDARVVGRDAR